MGPCLTRLTNKLLKEGLIRCNYFMASESKDLIARSQVRKPILVISRIGHHNGNILMVCHKYGSI